ncbi:PREDICTED: F-box protein DOR-like [Tarenaya hassleriana]|uniref:F-box protein DOR-like n=1 Tax=Tarenaya hassleriana TaxID=28532 RepID=UPI00053C662D|nr:PREDICTED: F-box protein DOR-like [Tarenaya hassleriana]
MYSLIGCFMKSTDDLFCSYSLIPRLVPCENGSSLNRKKREETKRSGKQRESAMRARGERKIIKNRRTTSHHDSRASTSRNLDEEEDGKTPDSDPIPLDLTVDILTRLPVKSLVRFLCVSKGWSSTISGRDFANSFMTRSLTRPRLLLTFIANNKYVFFSLTHPQNSDMESSSVATYVYDMNWSVDWAHPVRGLVCVGSPPNLAICNPSTNQFITLPKVKTRRKDIHSFFGYDPIDDQYKVLSMTVAKRREVAEEHQVLTLGTRKTWRMIESTFPHWPRIEGLCLNGVLYYGAWCFLETIKEDVIMRFDVRSERFDVMKVPQGSKWSWSDHPTLISYKGKLACLNYGGSSIHLWVLEDAEKQEWSEISSVFPPIWNDSIWDNELSFSGTIRTGELVMTSGRFSLPLYVFYCHMERNVIKRVEIWGISEHRVIRQYSRWRLKTSADYVESIEFL